MLRGNSQRARLLAAAALIVVPTVLLATPGTADAATTKDRADAAAGWLGRQLDDEHLITTTFDGPLCGRVQNWDDHGVNHHVFDALAFRLPVFDQAVTALIEDVYARGLDKRVLVVVTGEFGRTPRISYNPSSGGGVASGNVGVMQPGRDHWPAANSMLFAGGGIRTGQVIGGTDRRGEEVTERRMGTGDFLATIYRHLGIDSEKIAIPNFAGRPIPLVSEGQAIRELQRVS